MNRTLTRRALLATAPALLLAACGGDGDSSEEWPMQPVRLTLAGLRDVPTGTYLFRAAADAAAFLARYEPETLQCNSAGQCLPGHTPPPELDWQRYAVAGLCAGPSGTCESLTLLAVRLRGNTAVLDYRVSRPDPAAGIACPAVVTWMTAFVQVPAGVTSVEVVRV